MKSVRAALAAVLCLAGSITLAQPAAWDAPEESTVPLWPLFYHRTSADGERKTTALFSGYGVFRDPDGTESGRAFPVFWGEDYLHAFPLLWTKASPTASGYSALA